MSRPIQAVSFAPPEWSRYSHQPTTSPEIEAYKTLIAELQRRLDVGEPIYVGFNDHRRKGAVGLVKSMTLVKENYTGYYYSYNPPKYDRYRLDDIEVVWNGRKNVVKPYSHEIFFLPDWNQDTVWSWIQEKREIVIPTIKDHLGEEVSKDDFVSFVSRTYGNVSLHFGNVSRINENGSVWVNTLKLRSNDRPSEVKVHDTDTIVKIGKDLIDRLILARMTTR